MNFVFAIVAICACISTSSATAAENQTELFKLFRSKYGIKYNNPNEKTNRLSAFEKNKDTVKVHNQRHAAGLSKFTLELNKFGDLSHGDFVKKYTGYIQPMRDTSNSLLIAGHSNGRVEEKREFSPNVADVQNSAGNRNFLRHYTGYIPPLRDTNNSLLIAGNSNGRGEERREFSPNVQNSAGNRSFLRHYTGYIPPMRDTNNSLFIAGNSNGHRVEGRKPSIRPNVAVVPTSFDWRTSGSVSSVKDQGDCGSCWAFASIGTLESHSFIKNKKMPSLSEQNLVDCTQGQKYWNLGCNGGSTSKGYLYIKDNLGVDTGVSYPYEGVDTNGCRFKRATVGATDSGFVSITKGDENKMKTVVATIGPVSVALYVSDVFMNYQRGIYDEDNCSTIVNHAVIVTGYGTENGVDYWTVKNSWGPDWGENGYFRIVRGSNKCGIGNWATYPML